MGGRRGYSIPIDLDAVLERYARGESLAAIARSLGCHYNTLNTRTARAGIVFTRNPKGLAPTIERKRPVVVRKPRKRIRKAEPTEVPPAQSDHTRRFFKAWDEWDREMRADLKAKLWQQVQALRA